MPDLVFTYYIEIPLVIISINNGSCCGGAIVIMLDIEICLFGKDGIKKGDKERGGWVAEEIWRLLGFVALVCVWVYFCCSVR
jgi:hypothetical protein